MGNRMLSDEILLALIKKNSGGGQSAIHVKGVTTTALTDGCNTNPITINGESYTAVDGDLVAYQSKEFLFNGAIWQELGDVSEVMAIIEKILDDIADEFDATTTYAVDDFVVKDSVLYKCISAHTGAWDANDFITTTVVDEIASKQNTLAVGKYIDITNGKISVDRVIPNESFMYNFKILELHTVHVTKTVNGAVVFEQDYTDATASTPIIFDDAIKFYADGYWYFEYELLIDSNSHNAGFKQRWSSLERNINYTEDFDSIDNTGKKLIIKSEMDDAIGALQDGQNIDSFGDVESALSDKQDVLIAGKYINIDANNEISVDPVVPNEAFTYTIKQIDDYSLEIIKTVDDVVVFDEVYACWDPVAQQQHDINETFDDAINIHVYQSGERSYTLLIASDTHEAGFKQTTPWWERNTFVETFSTVDHSGEKLVIKSDMDTALAGKQDNLTAGDYIKFKDEEISVKRLVLDGDEYTYDIYSKSTQTHVVVDKYDSNSTLVSTREYYMNDLSPAVEVDGLFTLYAYGGPWTCTLLVASKDHAAGYSFSSQWNEYTHHTEIFELPPEESPNDLIVRSELDTALAGKQGVLTFDNAPTDGSNNPVKSDGIYDALAGKQDIFERISYANWQLLTPQQQAAKPYYIYDYPSTQITAANVSYDHTQSGLSATTAQGGIDELASEKQDATDNSLQTTDKTVVGGINELKSGLTNVNSKITGVFSTAGLSSNGCEIMDGGYTKIGNLVFVQLLIKATSAKSLTINGFPKGVGPQGVSQYPPVITADDSNFIFANFLSDGMAIFSYGQTPVIGNLYKLSCLYLAQ